MDNVLNMGLDGWKCDGTDPYIFVLGYAHGHDGHVSERDYANLYYRDFFYYTRTKNPDSLIMARPVDSEWSFAPHDVMFSGWVGDDDPAFNGLRSALWSMLTSAQRNYLNFGSDTGGYRGGDRSKELLIRWAQMSAFCPLFENGGNGEHRPWLYDQETTDIYRDFVNAHYELVPYLLSAGTTAYTANVSVMIPNKDPSLLPDSDDWGYRLWTDIFVSPITQNKTQDVTVHFPEGDDWVDWWDGTTTHAGGSNVTLTFALDRFPAFKREGSIIPLDVSVDGSLHGDSRSRGHLTLQISHPLPAGGHTNVYEWKGTGVEAEYSVEQGDSDGSFGLNVVVTAYHKPVVARITGVCAGVETSVHDATLPGAPSVPRTADPFAAGLTGGWTFVAGARELVLVAPAASVQRGTFLRVSGLARC
eukprot:TRINITY_DN533_c0_g1_i1.p1 TRINITY_DN533_c0_g1~~TRINITY_DN533_c0_g1_i1.p1  ORF type:complete len:417 (+),score=66.11 TRINITY_DN533_c0_g1_i1:679-1929(+)